MKQFIVDRHTTPNTPTLEQVPTEKIPIYENRAAVTADLANLSVGQIVATKDTGDELAQPVDAVESGNLHAVTSNAVAGYIKTLDIQINYTLNDWQTESNGGFYCNKPVSDYIQNYTKLLSIVSIRYSGFSVAGFYVGFDSMASNILCTTDAKKVAQLNARIVYI